MKKALGLFICFAVTVSARTLRNETAQRNQIRRTDGKVRLIEPNEFVARARKHAIQVIVERMFRALGEDFPDEPNMTIPISDVIPTPAKVKIKTDPCPDVYTKCSSESFVPSCEPPNGSIPTLWNKMYNLYFPLPDDLFDSDNMLKATVQLYKNLTLPLEEPTLMTVELYAYTGNRTNPKEYITSTNVTSDYIGWVKLDVTELVETLQSDNNHGFQIKVKEENGIYWNDIIFTPMDCSNDKVIIPLPLGVETDQPEQRFPSLNIRTGTPELHEDLPIDTEPLIDYYPDTYHNDDPFLSEILDMPGDDPNVSETETPSPIDSFTLTRIHLPPKKVSDPQPDYSYTTPTYLNLESFEDQKYLDWLHKEPVTEKQIKKRRRKNRKRNRKRKHSIRKRKHSNLS